MHTTLIARQKEWKQIVFLVALFFILSCNLMAPTSDTREIKNGLVQNYHVRVSAESMEQYNLSLVQEELILNYGYPDRFIISFLAMTLESGDVIDLRQESWYYDQAGYEVVFRNGEKFVEEGRTPVSAPGLGSTKYHPEDFVQDMSLVAVLAVTGENAYFADSINDEIIVNGQIVFLKGLGAGFQDGMLRYIETLPLGNAGATH